MFKRKTNGEFDRTEKSTGSHGITNEKEKK
jgi:hypothetical protein